MNTNMKAMQEEIAKLKAQIDAAKAARTVTLSDGSTLTLKVTPKGGVAVYGMGRFPVSLYGNQWLKIIEAAAEIHSYVQENKDKLSVKTKSEESAA